MIPGTALVLYVIGVNAVVIGLLISLLKNRRRIAALKLDAADTRLKHNLLEQEKDRLAGRLAAVTRITAPIAARARTDQSLFISRHDLAVLAILAEHPGPEGEQLVELEAAYHAGPRGLH